MAGCAGIRREDKNEWERRTPLTPQHVKELREKHGVKFVVQPSAIRVYADTEYNDAGARLDDDLSSCDAVFAVKEIPVKYLQPDKTYVFFAHVIKGQSCNMPMLKKLMELGCNLIDYEKVMDDNGRRLIFFGRHAGIAGAIETLCALGQRLKSEGIDTPFTQVKRAYEYHDMRDIEQSLKAAGELIARDGLPGELTPLVIGIAGYGNVGGGAREIIDILPHHDVKASELAGLARQENARNDLVYKVVFKEEDMVEPVLPEGEFLLQDYYDHPEKYRGRFESYLPCLTVLINTIYWEAQYPRLVTNQALKELFSSQERPRLRVIGDISCDIEGAVEATVRSTEPGNPCYVYNPADGTTLDGCEGDGVVIMAVDHLPCEIPAESSADFSRVLESFVAPVVEADYSKSFDELVLPPEIKRALILHRGRFTPDYKYLGEFVK
jgi:alpha-aminoadipic semialdehyde synthase